MPEADIVQLARRIWLEHHEAMRILLDNRPDWSGETRQMLKEIIAGQPEWELDVESSAYLRFRSEDWGQYESWQTGRGWTGSRALFLFEFGFSSSYGRPWIQLPLSPKNDANDRLRSQLFDAAKQNPSLFRPRPSALSDTWTHLHVDEDYMLEESDYGLGWENGTTRNKIEDWVADFAATRFRAMNEVIVNCLREYEAEKQGS